MKTSLDLKLSGYEPANRDAVVELTQEGTGKTFSVKPYLDGSLSVRDLDPGNYQVAVKHPNSIVPLYQNTIRVFDQVAATFHPITIDPAIFRIPPEPMPFGNLAPVRQVATSVKDRMAPIGGKSQGEVIKSADWNALVAAVGDLAGAIVQLTQLVAPVGHHHPDVDAKIAQVSQSLTDFAQSFGRAQLQYQRVLEVNTLRQYADQVLTFGKATEAESKALNDKLADLAASVDVDSATFTHKLVAASNQALVTINTLAARVDNFLANDAVKQLQALARQHADLGVQFDPGNEVWHYVGGAGGVVKRQYTMVRPSPFERA